jgi:RHS repeat-associated protein
MTLAPRPGDEATATEGLLCVWDAWNRLRSVSKNDATAGTIGIGDTNDTPATLIAEYEYDGIHRRIRKTVYVIPEKIKDPKTGELVNTLAEPAVDFVLDYYYLSSKSGVANDWQVCEVRKTVGETTHPYKQYVWGIRYVHAAICRFRDTDFNGTMDENVYYTQDANFNTTSLVAPNSGAVIERYHYDPYGKMTVYDASWNSRAASLYDNVVLFTGHKRDTETGLYHGNRRPYHPTMGRWIGRDPKEDVDGANFYEYVKSSPEVFYDPFGLWTAEGLIQAYRSNYGEENYKKLCQLLATGLKIDSKCYWLDDWDVEGNTIYIAETINFGSERSNENAAYQLNEVLSSRFNIGEVSWEWRVRKMGSGTLKMVGGGLAVAGGVAIIGGTEGLGAVPGYALAAFGGSTCIEGATEFAGGIAGEDWSWNPGRWAAGKVGEAVGGETGKAIGELTYNIADIGVNLFGAWKAVGKIRAITKNPFTVEAKLGVTYTIRQGYQVPRWYAWKGNIIQLGLKVKQPWIIKTCGHLIEAGLAGDAILEDVESIEKLSRIDEYLKQIEEWRESEREEYTEKLQRKKMSIAALKGLHGAMPYDIWHNRMREAKLRLQDVEWRLSVLDESWDDLKQKTEWEKEDLKKWSEEKLRLGYRALREGKLEK